MRAECVDSLRATDEAGLLAPLKHHKPMKTAQNLPSNITTKNANTKTPAHEPRQRRTRMAAPTKRRHSPDDDNEGKMGWEPRQAPPTHCCRHITTDGDTTSIPSRLLTGPSQAVRPRQPLGSHIGVDRQYEHEHKYDHDPEQQREANDTHQRPDNDGSVSMGLDASASSAPWLSSMQPS